MPDLWRRRAPADRRRHRHHLQGLGFYVTDSKNGGRANGAPNQEKDADKAAAGDAKDGSKESTTAKDAKPSGSESTGSASKGGDGGAQPTKDPKPAATTS